MTRPIIAIVGRTNVGKSTLLNRLAGKRLAVVDDVAGITRDRVFASASWQSQELTLVDTAGWQVEAGSRLEQKVKQQVEIAVAQAEVIIFVVDAREGVIAVDEEIADALRVGGKPTVLAVNKVDSLKQRNEVADFCSLGMGVPIGISAYHGRGIDELMDAVLQVLPATGSVEESEQTRFAVVGRPNVGKSTLLNSLLGYQRAIADEAPGTTRDALDAGLRWDGKDILLIDTAGVKRPGRVDSGVDYYSMLRALQAINRCDV
ncbi:MAG: ribosome biogenesis GTPase Der, partial [Dehalococcoidia bacterium]|nr:ribosome biogenesis GTPase Der [Dehalococcoidia bacterium]